MRIRRRRWAFAAAASAAPVVAGLAMGGGALTNCRPLRGPSGVIVTVNLDMTSGWAQTDAFDHITVIATDGTTRGVGCLSATQGNTRAFLPDADPSASDPCADEPGLAWDTAPTVATWKLDQEARTIDFAFAENANVHVVATAALGGRSNIGSATADGVATIGTTPLALSLAKGPAAPSCNLVVGANLGPQANGIMFSACTMPAVTCLDPTTVAAPSIGRTAGAVCDDAGVTLHNVTGDTCSTGVTANEVLRTEKFLQLECQYIALRGHFFRCREGAWPQTPCTPTADCTPPATALVASSVSGATSTPFPLDCVPSFVFPVDLLLTLDPTHLTGQVISLVQAPTGDPHACVFVLESVHVGSSAMCSPSVDAGP